MLSDESETPYPSYRNSKLKFYYLHFGHLEFQNYTQSLDSFLNNNQISSGDIWGKLSKYIVPGIGGRPENPHFKTLNKAFLKTISQSRPFISKLFELNLDLMMFMGYSWKVNWQLLPSCRLDQMDLNGISIIEDICKDNQKEIQKMYVTWDNILAKETNSKTDEVHTIINSMQHKKYAFPWSFKEVQMSFIHTFLVMAETIQFDFLSSAIPSNSVFFN
jgi:hypothetical protein